jgi:hypothetical protein
MTRAEFAVTVLWFCDRFGASVTSWTRTTAHNEKVGGVEHSAHLVALAADVVYDAPPNERELAWFCSILGIEVLHEADHDHLQPKGWVEG